MKRSRSFCAGLFSCLAAACGSSSGERTNGAGGSGGATMTGGGDAGGGAGAPNGGAVSGGGVSGGGAGAGSAVGGMNGGEAPCVIATATQSAIIPTVYNVTFTTTLAEPTRAEIEFGPLAGGPTMIAPVDLTRPAYETTLVGMKPSSSYVYRVEVTSDTRSCASDDHTILTGELANPPPAPAVTVMDPERHYQRGFTLAVSNDAELGYAFIYDADGTVVWAAPPGSVPDWPSRAHLSWDATRFIVMALNWGNTDIGVITSMAMDGSDVKSIEGATSAHHDFVAIPGGIAAFLWSADGADAPSSLVEFLDAGGSRTVVSDIATLYTGEAPSSFHANSVHYHPSDETYTLGDRRWSQYLKVTRDGELVWQLGGMEPLDPAKVFSGVDPWLVGHGHHLTSDGTFAFFDNNFERGQMTPATVHVYHLDEPTLTATRLAMFAAQGSSILGDVQRLPSGNFLVTNSDSGFVQEMTSEGGVVAVIYPASSGYSEFRESLYGPPPY